MSKKILVTGGTGYIGSHTVVELIQQGYEPIIIDNLYNSELSVLDGIKNITGTKPKFYQVEMCDLAAMKAFFEKEKDIADVIHFAAVLLVDESVSKPHFYYHNNLVSTLNLLECMQLYGIRNLVFSSSCTVYGNPDSLPVKEDAGIKPAASPYGNTKKICEEIISDVCKASQLKAISLRYFNPIGNHQSVEIGEIPHGVPTHLVPYITQTARGIRPFLKVFGSDYNTHDGTCIRDYIHVVDLAEAHISAIKRLMDKQNASEYEFFNIGTGNGFSVLDMIKAFERATGINIPYELTERRAGDVEAVYADTSKAEMALQWKAKLGVEEMLRSAWNWELKLTGGLNTESGTTQNT